MVVRSGVAEIIGNVSKSQYLHQHVVLVSVCRFLCAKNANDFVVVIYDFVVVT